MGGWSGVSAGKRLQQKQATPVAKATGSTAAAAVTASRKSSRSCGKDRRREPIESDVFHAIVGHYVGCGWDAEAYSRPPGAASRRALAAATSQKAGSATEIARSAGKYAQTELPLCSDGGWTAKAPPEPEEPPQPDQPPEDELDDPELDDDPDGDDLGEELPKHDPNLPRLYAHGDPDPRPIKSWLIKGLIPARRARAGCRASGVPARRSSSSISRPL